MRILFFSLIIFLVSFSAHSHPASDTPKEFSDWFKSLKDMNGRLCCDISDCRFVESRFDETSRYFEANVERENFAKGIEDRPSDSLLPPWRIAWFRRFGNLEHTWVVIPDEKINYSRNQTGHAVLCFSPYGSAKEFDGIYCFVPFFGT